MRISKLEGKAETGKKGMEHGGGERKTRQKWRGFPQESPRTGGGRAESQPQVEETWKGGNSFRRSQ